MSSQVTTVQLSQANQAYVNSLTNKQAQLSPLKNNDREDKFISSKNNPKKFLKLGLIGAGLTFCGLVIASIIKKGKLPTNIGEITGSKPIITTLPFNQGFNHEKLFNEPINLDSYYQKTLDKIKDVKLDLAFDEKTVTETQIADALKKIGVLDYNIDKQQKLVKQNPSLLHTLNILSGSNPDEAKFPTYIIRNVISDIDPNMSIADIDNYFKYLTFCKDTSILYSNTLSKNSLQHSREIIGLNGLLKEAEERVFGKYSGCYAGYVRMYPFDENPDANKGINEFLKFVASLKKGTVEQGSAYDLYDGLLALGDYKKARRFYEALNDNVLGKLSIDTIYRLLSNKEKTSIEIAKLLNDTPPEILEKFSIWEIPTYVNFSEFYGIEYINQLSIAQKKNLLRRLVKSNSSSFDSGKSIAKILPSNQEEYCKLMDKLAKSIGVNTTKLSPKEIQSFNGAIGEISRTIQGVDLNNTVFKLDFSREDFISEVQKELDKLSDKEKMQVMDYFGFELKEGKLYGYPININNGEKLSEVSSSRAKTVIESLRKTVDRFSKNNRVTVEGASKEFNESINKILDAFPELRTMIQKAQHETHAFTLDIHTFKVLQNVCSNPKFKQLSDDDKKVLEIASLLHDITKVEGIRDCMHPIESAFDAYYIIQKLNLPENQQLKIYELIKTHNWLQQLNDPKNRNLIEEVAQDIAFDARHTNTFEMAKILCEADLKSVKKDAGFFDSNKRTLEEMSAKVDGYVKSLHDTQIILPQTVIPKASKIQNGVVKSADGIQNVIIYMDKADNDLSGYGFSSGTTKGNWTAIVHALEKPEQMSKFDTFNVIDTEALLSTSFINPQEYRVFRKQGLILDVNFNDIHAGYETDFGTGYGKTLDILKEDYLFHGCRKRKAKVDGWRQDRSSYRTFISDKIKELMGLKDEEYYKRVEKIQDCKSLTDIEQVDKEFAACLRDLFKNMHAHKRRGGRKYNEMLITRPKIQGVFAYDKPYEEIPQFLRKYASDNDLPIIIFGSK